MSKNHDSKKSEKKAPTKTLKEKREMKKQKKNLIGLNVNQTNTCTPGGGCC